MTDKKTGDSTITRIYESPKPADPPMPLETPKPTQAGEPGTAPGK